MVRVESEVVEFDDPLVKPPAILSLAVHILRVAAHYGCSIRSVLLSLVKLFVENLTLERHVPHEGVDIILHPFLANAIISRLKSNLHAEIVLWFFPSAFGLIVSDSFEC